MKDKQTGFKSKIKTSSSLDSMIWALMGILLLLSGCKEAQSPISLEQAIIKLQKGDKELPQDLITQAQNLIAQSQRFNFKLLDSKELAELSQKKQVHIIDTSLKGRYSLEHLEGAVHFDASILPQDGEMQEEIKKKFLHKIGTNLLIPLVFYTQDPSPTDANNASIWAKKLGYQNVYRLTSNLKECKTQGLKTTNEVPKCCQNS